MDRRRFLGASGLLAAAAAVPTAWPSRALAQGQPRAPRRQVRVGGKRVKTVDIHAHVSIPEAAALAPGGGGGGGGVALEMTPSRLAAMDAQGIDVEVLSVNPNWYAYEQPLAERLLALQNEKLAALVAAQPDRFVALAGVALQFPELACEQLEDAVKRWKMRGVAIGASVGNDELAHPRFDPFWAKAQELGATVFMHPQQAGANPRLKGSGALGVTLGNPIETSIALTHLIFEGTLDRFPELRFCAAHGGGFLASYTARMDNGCRVFPDQCRGPVLKKKPSEYLRQIYVDSIVFTAEGLRHLVAEVGAGHIVLGTDYPYPWTSTAVDHVLQAPGLNDAERIGILGSTAARLLGIPTTE